nr:facilitated trehalose transporter Tret1-2 homolog [Procambarus clarkii]
MKEGEGASPDKQVKCEASSRFNQYYSTVAVTLASLAMGTAMGYTSPAGPLIMGTPGALNLSQNQYDWFLSSINLGAAAGGLLGGWGINTLGRRATILVSCPPCLAGWALIGSSSNFAMLLGGRVVTGVCVGVTSVAVPTYIGEIASPHIRGVLGSGVQLMLSVGVVVVYGAGAAVGSWRWLAFCCSVVPLLCFALVIFTHESPAFLVSRGRDQHAAAALHYFRGKHHNISEELEKLQSFHQETQERGPVSLRDLSEPKNYRPFMICLSLLLFSQFCGMTPVVFNMATVFKDSGVALSANVSAQVVGWVQVVGTAAASVLMDKAGRKVWLLVSTAGTAASIVGLGTYFYLKKEDSVWTSENLDWLPLACLVVFMAAFSLGLGPVPWVTFGEMLPHEVKAVTGSLVSCAVRIAAFVSTITFVPLQASLGEPGVYWLYGAVCLLGLVYTLLMVPETKGMTLHQINMHFHHPDSVNASKMDPANCSSSQFAS